MDIIYYVCLLIVIGVFFFLDKYNTTSNSMYFVILFSLLGWFLLLNTNVELVDYNSIIKINSSYVEHPKTDLTYTGFGILNVQTFFLLSYWTFLLIGILNLSIGKKEFKNKD